MDHTYPKFIFEKKFSGMVLMILDSYFDPNKSTTSNQYFYRKATSAEAQIFITSKDQS